MLDIKFIRQNPNLVKEAAEKKGFFVNINEILELDRKKRKLQTEIERIRAFKNKISQRLKNLKEKEEILKLAKEEDKKEEKLKKEFKEINEKLKELLLKIPNLPLPNVPVGKDEKDNVVLREVGEKPQFDFAPRDYLLLSQELDLIDIMRAGKISGSRFAFLKRESVFLEIALLRYVFELLTKEGFLPILPPVLLKKEIMRGTGYLEHKDIEEVYFIEKDNLFLAGTAEQPLLAMHANEILKEKDLPLRYVGFSTCFRREAGSWGKETWGIFRVHQFDKIEMFSFTKPDDSQKEHQFFLKLQEKIMQDLKIPYRVVQICSGDLGFPAAEKYDIEAWFPSKKTYLETHSTSNCTDFQARRLNIRYKRKDGKLEFVHTVNGTAIAIGRILISIFENYQQKDGSIKVPEILKKYLSFEKIPSH